MTQPPRKILPRNLTAWGWAAWRVVGNPEVTRPEDAVANCYPGLELDVRNLDRRFFPGLVFDFVAPDDIKACGARLAYVDHKQDPDLFGDQELEGLYDALDAQVDTLASGVWFLEWIEQAGKRLVMWDTGDPLDGLVVWRIVRGLEPGRTLTIALSRRDAVADVVTFTGKRRLFIDEETGALSHAYQPGELTQSLCSPWQHDFRDCACHYWASNRPDVVLGETYPGQASPAGRADVLLDWMRRDRSPDRSAGAVETIAGNRPYQLDHFEINHAWRRLDVVLNNREIGEVYVPLEASWAKPYATSAELAGQLRRLAQLEMALAVEYIYALFSLRSPEEVKVKYPSTWATLASDVREVRDELLLVATSEMNHLRSVNELLWTLGEGSGRFKPVLTPARRVPIGGDARRDAALRRLTPEVVDEFIAVEAPSGLVTGGYARVVATLSRRRYSPRMRQVAARIVQDGVDHERSFRRIKRVLDAYANAQPPWPYLRELKLGSQAKARVGIQKYRQIISALESAYRAAADGNAESAGETVSRARIAMKELLEIGEKLAAQGVGIPFPGFGSSGGGG